MYKNNISWNYDIFLYTCRNIDRLLIFLFCFYVGSIILVLGLDTSAVDNEKILKWNTFFKDFPKTIDKYFPFSSILLYSSDNSNMLFFFCTKKDSQFLESLLVGLVGFEHTHARVKVWCLTAWLQPNVI